MKEFKVQQNKGILFSTVLLVMKDEVGIIGGTHRRLFGNRKQWHIRGATRRLARQLPPTGADRARGHDTFGLDLFCRYDVFHCKCDCIFHYWQKYINENTRQFSGFIHVWKNKYNIVTKELKKKTAARQKNSKNPFWGSNHVYCIEVSCS